jgi:acyl carrier protein
MERDEVMKLVSDHLSTELEVAPEKIQPETRFREDLDADSLDLYELVMELEDRHRRQLSL